MRNYWYAMILSSVALLLMGFNHAPNMKHAMYVTAEKASLEEEQVLTVANDQNVNVLYLEIDQELDAATYRSFNQKASQAGIEVYAMGGDPTWAQPSHQEDVLQFVGWVNGFNDNSEEASQFSGIHVEIKGYHLPSWPYEKNDILTGWKENVTALVDAAKESDQTVTQTIPFWFNTLTTPDTDDVPFHEWLMKQYDQTTVSAFRETLEGDNGIMSLIKEELATADENGESLLIGVTMEDGGHDYVSFAEEGVDDMNMHLGVLEKHLSDHNSYKGTAFQSYSDMKEHLDLVYPENPDPIEPPAEKLRGTYVWEAERLMHEQDQILTFAKEHDLNYLYTRLDLRVPYSSYRDFVQRANEMGIEVHAMGGHPTWAQASERDHIKKLTDYVKNYNANVEANAQFAGIHLDIEPYTLPSWDEDQDSIISQWKENLEYFVSETKDGTDLETSVDLAMWFDDMKVPGTEEEFSRWVIGTMDHTSVMAFRDFTEGRGGILYMIQEELQHAEELNKEILLSVEMKENPYVNHISFHEEGKTYMEEELDKLKIQLDDHPTYNGYLIHSYRYWKNAKE